MLRFSILAIVAAVIGSSDLLGQTWSTEHHFAGLGGRCFGLGTWNGDLVAGGRAFYQDGVALDCIVRFDGNRWRTIGPTNIGTGSAIVRAIAEFRGDLIVGGDFTAVGAVPADNISRFDGTRWQPLGSGLSGEVFALAVYRGDLFAAGFFQQAGGQNIAGLARWDGSSWHAVGSGLRAATSYGPRVTSLLAASDGRLYLGGSFTQAGAAATSNNIAAWDGTTFHAVGAGFPGTVSTFVFALAEFQGSIYAAGNFGAAGTQNVDNIARFDGQQWHAVGGGIPDWSISSTAYSLRVFQGRLLVGGNFIEVGGPRGSGVAASRVAAWDGQQWHASGGISGSDLTTTAIAMTEWNGQLVVGGEFVYAGTDLSIGRAVVSRSVAAHDGQAWSQLGRGLGVDSMVRKFVPWRGGWVAVGMFLTAGRALAPRVADFDGEDFRALGSFDGNVHDALVWNGELVVTGDFQQVDGQPIRAVARYDGSAWHAVGQGAGGWCLEVHGGLLHAGGIGGARRFNGTAWETFMPATGGNVNDMLSLGGTLYVGGSMPQGLLAWDGTTLTPVGGGTDRTVNELFDWNGRLLAGGEFTRAGTTSAGGAAVWDGQQWTAVGQPLTAGGFESFAVLDGVLYGGGTFTHYRGFAAAGLARLDPLQGWQPVAAPSTSDVHGAVLDLCADPLRARLFVAGGFLRAGGAGTGYAARSLTVFDWRQPWQDVGFGLAGNRTPELAARGLPSIGRATTFTLQAAEPRGAGLFVAGVGRANVPLLGGTLVPPPALTLFAATDVYGRWTAEVRIPRGVPIGTEFTAQAWLLDGGGPQGAAASNAVAATVR